MDESIKEAWTEVGEEFAELGRRVSEHYKKLGGEQPTAGEQEEMRQALRKIADEVDRAFTSLGDTFRDPEAKEGFGRVVKSLGTALTTTFSSVGAELRARSKSKPGEAPPGASSTEPPPEASSTKPPTDPPSTEPGQDE